MARAVRRRGGEKGGDWLSGGVPGHRAVSSPAPGGRGSRRWRPGPSALGRPGWKPAVPDPRRPMPGADERKQLVEFHGGVGRDIRCHGHHPTTAPNPPPGRSRTRRPSPPRPYAHRRAPVPYRRTRPRTPARTPGPAHTGFRASPPPTRTGPRPGPPAGASARIRPRAHRPGPARAPARVRSPRPYPPRRRTGHGIGSASPWTAWMSSSTRRVVPIAEMPAWTTWL